MRNLRIFQTKDLKEIAILSENIQEVNQLSPIPSDFHPVQRKLHPHLEEFHLDLIKISPIEATLSEHPQHAIYPPELHPHLDRRLLIVQFS